MTVVYIFIVFKFLYPFCIRYFGLPYISSLAVNSALVAFCVLVALTLPAPASRQATTYRRDIVLFVLLIALSGVLNSSHWLVVAKSLIEVYLPGVALFVIITSIPTSEIDRRRIVGLCYVLIVVQIPVSLAQYLLGNYPNLDSNSGTISQFNLGGTGVNAVLASFLVSRCLTKSFMGATKWYLLLAACAMIPIVVGGARFGLLLVPLATLTLVLVAHLTSWRRSIHASLGMTILVAGIAAVVALLIHTLLATSTTLYSFLGLDLIADPSARAAYDSYRGTGRISYYGVIHQRLTQSWSGVLFGLGSEAIEQSHMIGVGSMWPDSFKIGLSTGLMFFAGIGALGLLFLMYVFARGIGFAASCSSSDQPLSQKAEALSFVPISVVWIAASGYTDVWSTQAGIVYWVLLGVLVDRFGVQAKKETEVLASSVRGRVRSRAER